MGLPETVLSALAGMTQNAKLCGHSAFKVLFLTVGQRIIQNTMMKFLTHITPKL